MTDLIGKQIDRYIIENEIGRGGMARVYRAHDTTLNRDVALKILLPEITSDEVSLARFLREARSAARLDHPHIVQTYDTGQADGHHFIAMRYVDGRTLREILTAEGRLDPADVRDYLSQIASALDYAHQQGIVHRDIKPENILIDASGMAMLTDFGIASAIDEMSVTTTGNVVGTPVYMSPEQLRGGPASPRSEVYALGVLVYELLSGATPFAGRPPYAVMLAHLDEQPERVDRIRADIPADVGAAISRALEKDPSERYRSAGEFARQFALAVDGAPTVAGASAASATAGASSADAGAPTQVVSAIPADRFTSSWRNRWGLSIAGTGFVLGLLLLGAGAFAGGDPPSDDGSIPSIVTLSETATSVPPPTATDQPEVVEQGAQPEDIVEPVYLEEPTPEAEIQNPEPQSPSESPVDEPDSQQTNPEREPGEPKEKEKPDKPGQGKDKKEKKSEKETDDEDNDDEDDDEDDADEDDD